MEKGKEQIPEITSSIIASSEVGFKCDEFFEKGELTMEDDPHLVRSTRLRFLLFALFVIVTSILSIIFLGISSSNMKWAISFNSVFFFFGVIGLLVALGCKTPQKGSSHLAMYKAETIGTGDGRNYTLLVKKSPIYWVFVVFGLISIICLAVSAFIFLQKGAFEDSFVAGYAVITGFSSLISAFLLLILFRPLVYDCYVLSLPGKGHIYYSVSDERWKRID